MAPAGDRGGRAQQDGRVPSGGSDCATARAAGGACGDQRDDRAAWEKPPQDGGEYPSAARSAVGTGGAWPEDRGDFSGRAGGSTDGRGADGPAPRSASAASDDHLRGEQWQGESDGAAGIRHKCRQPVETPPRGAPGCGGHSQRDSAEEDRRVAEHCERVEMQGAFQHVLDMSPSWKNADIDRSLDKLDAIGIRTREQLLAALQQGDVNERLERLNKPTFCDQTIRLLKQYLTRGAGPRPESMAMFEKRLSNLEKTRVQEIAMLEKTMTDFVDAKLDEQLQELTKRLEGYVDRKLATKFDHLRSDITRDQRDDKEYLKSWVSGRMDRIDVLASKVKGIEKHLARRQREAAGFEHPPHVDIYSECSRGSSRQAPSGATARVHRVGGRSAHREGYADGRLHSSGHSVYRSTPLLRTAASDAAASWDEQSLTIDEHLSEYMSSTNSATMAKFQEIVRQQLRLFMHETFHDCFAEHFHELRSCLDNENPTHDLDAWLRGGTATPISVDDAESFRGKDVAEVMARMPFTSHAKKCHDERSARAASSARRVDVDALEDHAPLSEPSSARLQGQRQERYCFLPGTAVYLYGGGSKPIEDVRVGDKLRGGDGAQPAVVQSITELAASVAGEGRMVIECDVHTRAAQLSFKVTSNHPVPVLQPGNRRYFPVPAWDLKVGDRVRTFVHGEEMVGTIQGAPSEQEVHTACFQLVFEDPTSTVYIAMDGQPDGMYVELYGELAPRNPRDFVKHLRFRHFDRFEKLSASPQLDPFVQNMLKEGCYHDLSEYGLGPGKMFVGKGKAKHVVRILQAKQAQGARDLTPRDVFVSKSVEKAVLEAVRLDVGGRRNWANLGHVDVESRSNLLWLDDQDLKLAQDPAYADKTMVIVERTFIDIHTPVEDAPSIKTQSTSDRHKASGDAFSPKNPRGHPLVSRRGQQ